MTLSSVVLPAPVGPRMARIFPLVAENAILLRMWLSLIVTFMPLTERMESELDRFILERLQFV